MKPLPAFRGPPPTHTPAFQIKKVWGCRDGGGPAILSVPHAGIAMGAARSGRNPPSACAPVARNMPHQRPNKYTNTAATTEMDVATTTSTKESLFTPPTPGDGVGPSVTGVGVAAGVAEGVP